MNGKCTREISEDKTGIQYTLLNSDSKRRYDSGNYASDFSQSTSNRNQSRNAQDEEEFYGFGDFLWDVQVTIADFFKDLQEEFQNLEASVFAQGKPKSLWEELAEIGEEFVEFLEKEFKITDEEVKGGTRKESEYRSSETERSRNNTEKESSIKENIDEIEATLAQLKKELGL